MSYINFVAQAPLYLDINTFKCMLSAVFGIGNVKKRVLFVMFHTYVLLQLSGSTWRRRQLFPPHMSATRLLAHDTYTQEQDQRKILNHHDSVKSLNILEG